jgi:hypothetical protein
VNFGIGVSAYKMRHARSIKEYDERVFSATPKGRIAEPLFVRYRRVREWLERHKGASRFVKGAHAAITALRRVRNTNDPSVTNPPTFPQSSSAPHRAPQGH